jgi:hypothetical protein
MAGNRDPYADEVAAAKAAMAEKRYADQPWSEWAGDAVGNALSTAKAILPTALGGKGEVGISDMAKGAYEGAKDAVTFPGDVLTGRQVLYDERGMPLEQAVGRSFNTAATVGGASSVVPVPDNSLRIFGGIKSKTADKNALTQAQIMESKGASPEEIHAATGWHRGTDEQWRYEIPDVGTTVDPGMLQLDLSSPSVPSASRGRLGDYMNHPEFFNAYPEMKNMDVRLQPGGPGSEYWGYYVPRQDNTGFIADPYIVLNSDFLKTPEAQRSTLLHEIQHAVQQKEGFMRGANPKQFQPDTIPDPRVKIYEEAVANDPEMQEYMAISKTPEFRAQLGEANEFYKKNFGPLFRALSDREAASGTDLTGEWFKLSEKYEKAVQERFPLMKRRAELANSLMDRGVPLMTPKNKFLTPMQAYERTAGEVEARNVQKRMDMPREELGAKTPASTEDINRNQQLVDWNDTSWRKGYANKGRVLSRATEEALRIAREGLAGLAKGKGRTPRELGEPYANQLPRVPFEEWRYEFEPTSELLPRKDFDPSTFKEGDVLIPLVGDRTSNARKITSIADQPLVLPTLTEGGPDYMRGPAQVKDKNAWASGSNVVTKLNDRMRYGLEASRKAGYKDPNVYGVYTAMGEQAGDFSTHPAEAVMGMLPHAKILKKDAREFDDAMREKFADWPGIMSPKAADYVINADAGAHRKAFLETIDSAKWRDKGFPDVSLARYATTTPELLDAPTEAAGYAIARMTPGVERPVTVPHRSYPTTMPGEYVGGLPPGLMRDEVFTQFSRKFDADPPERNYVMAKRRSFGMDPKAFQVLEGRDIEDLIRKVTGLKSEYADGGEVDDEVADALRIAKAEGGGATENPQVFLTDAQGRQYDATGKPITPAATQENSNSLAQDNGGYDPNVAPQNYETEVRPLIDYAMTPVDREGMPSEPDLVNAMRVATQVAASGQPVEDRGEGNLGRRRTEAVRQFMGAPVDGSAEPYKGPFGYNAPDMAAYVNTLIDFSPYGALEYAHDIPYEAGRTGDYGTAAVEGGVNALLTTPGIAMAGKGIKKGYEALRNSPKVAAAVAGAAGLTAAPAQAEAGPARWYSKLLEVANALPMEKMTGEQALAMLRKNVSPEELRWTGTDRFLTSNPRISKGELLDHISKNRLQLNEITLGGGKKPTRLQDVMVQDIPKEIRDKYMPQINELMEKKVRANIAAREMKQSMGDDRSVYMNDEKYLSNLQDALDFGKQIDDLSMAMRQEYVDSIGGLARPTKFHGYSTQGGEGYRENLYQFQRPPKYSVVPKGDEYHVVDENGKTVLSNRTLKVLRFYTPEDAENAAKLENEAIKDRYTSPHWDDKDVLFHTRSQTLSYDPPGANRPYKVHNVDENQSDPGQQGRKAGFNDPRHAEERDQIRVRMMDMENEKAQLTRDWVNKKNELLKPFNDKLKRDEEALREKYISEEITIREFKEAKDALYNEYSNEIQPVLQQLEPEREKIDAVRREQSALAARANEIQRKPGAVPLMPFVHNTEAWTDRAIKHELDKALDSGSDYFSWTPGNVHADRYNLTNYISEVRYDPMRKRFFAFDKNSGDMVLDRSISDPSEIDDFVGKEVADRLRAKADEALLAARNSVTIEEMPNGRWYVNDDYYGGEAHSTEKEARKDYEGRVASALMHNPGTISGLDLETGGEGMRKYYDMYGKRVQKVLEKATGTKVPIEEIEVQTADGPRKQFGIRLTDEMREKARFSDFARGGTVTGGHSHDNTGEHVNRALALTREF